MKKICARRRGEGEKGEEEEGGRGTCARYGQPLGCVSTNALQIQ